MGQVSWASPTGFAESLGIKEHHHQDKERYKCSFCGANIRMDSTQDALKCPMCAAPVPLTEEKAVAPTVIPTPVNADSEHTLSRSYSLIFLGAFLVGLTLCVTAVYADWRRARTAHAQLEEDGRSMKNLKGTPTDSNK